MTQSTSLAPIVVFAYARVDHLQRMIESLKANPQAADCHLHVYCDGPRSPAAVDATQAVRAFVDGLQGFASVTRTYRDSNFGLARSIVSGVTSVLEHHDSVIVLEDDLLLSPHFLAYMNDALAMYRDDTQVASIHGYCYPVQEPVPETFFMKGADCWGWGTWARAWKHFEPDGRVLLRQLEQRRLCASFDLDRSYPFTRMLRDQIRGRNDSWAIRWHASCYLQGMLTLYPGRSLVENLGMDNSGTHCAQTDVYAGPTLARPVRLERIALEESDVGRRAFVRFFRASAESLVDKVKRRLFAWRKAPR